MINYIKTFHTKQGKCRNIIAILVLLLCAVTILDLYQNSIDDYAPKHIGVGMDLINNKVESTSENLYYQIKGYYTFLSSFILITGIGVFQIPQFPILFIPYALTLFLLMYYLSNKQFLPPILITIFSLTAGLTGTHKIFIWPHGLAEIMFYISQYILLKLNNSTNKRFPGFLIILLIITTTIIFVSYNLTLYILCLYPSYVIANKIINYQINNELREFTTIFQGKNSYLWLTFSFGLIVFLHLSDFLYSTFIPLVKNISINSNPLETIERAFISKIVGVNNYEDNFLILFSNNYPEIIIYVGVIKNIIYGLTVLLALQIILKRYIYPEVDEKRTIQTDSLFIAISFVAIFFFVIRFWIGQFAIGEIYWIFIISIVIILSSISWQKRYKYIYMMLIGLIFLNLINIYVSSENEVIQKDDYNYCIQTFNWFYKYGNSHIYTTDQLTFGWAFLAHRNLRLKIPLNLEPLYLKNDNIMALYNNNYFPFKGYYAINYRSRYLAIGRWNFLQSLNKYKSQIDFSRNSGNKIFDNNVAIYLKFN